MCGVWGQHKTDEYGASNAIIYQHIPPRMKNSEIDSSNNTTSRESTSVPTDQPAFGGLMMDF